MKTPWLLLRAASRGRRCDVFAAAVPRNQAAGYTLANRIRGAAQLPQAWRSTVIASIGGAHLKLLRMDGAPCPNESHDYPEGLLVVDGQMHPTVAGSAITVRAGELFVVPPGVSHAVAPGSIGTLVIFDPA